MGPASSVVPPQWYSGICLLCSYSLVVYFEKQDGHHGRFSTFSKEFFWPSRTKGIIDRNLKFAGYVHHYKILTENIISLILKNKMAATGVFRLSVRSFVGPLE